ncbi:MAG: hypothetical protein BWY66_00571 [bacterium ADurb.Bin374]|nr:MAG: hypothetical protein BWY66_00571 [bacterium ADurb.Bin374]
MKRDTNEGIDIHDKTVTSNDMVKKVLDAQLRKREAQQMLGALKRERDAVLDEFNDFRKARPVPKSPSVPRSTKAEKVRITAADGHGMRQDAKAVAAFLADVKKHDPDEIVLLGDWLDCEGWLAKHHVVGFVSNCDYSYQEDVAATNSFLDKLQKAAPNAVIRYFFGNHEDRVERAIVDMVLGNASEAAFLNTLWGIESVLRLDERGIIPIKRDVIYEKGYPRGWVKLGNMCFSHEAGGKGKNAARDVVAKAATNVTFGHTHREDTATIVFPGVGICKAFNPGCLCQIQPIYMHSDPDSWSQGYAIDYIAKSGLFQRVQVPIWNGVSLGGAMFDRFKD